MKKRLFKFAVAIAVSGTLFSACSKDDANEEENDEELITTMKLNFVPVGGGSTVTYQFNDPDGPGGAAATQDEIVLAPSKTYNVTVQLLNASTNPPEDVTLEVKEEATAHRFYYAPASGSNITVSGFDNDSNGVPLGINSTWTTGAAATGKLQVILRHYPGNPPGKLTADLVTDSKSGTDIDVTFNTKIQ
jgi:hypothetical protein